MLKVSAFAVLAVTEQKHYSHDIRFKMWLLRHRISTCSLFFFLLMPAFFFLLNVCAYISVNTGRSNRIYLIRIYGTKRTIRQRNLRFTWKIPMCQCERRFSFWTLTCFYFECPFQILAEHLSVTTMWWRTARQTDPLVIVPNFTNSHNAATKPCLYLKILNWQIGLRATPYANCRLSHSKTFFFTLNSVTLLLSNRLLGDHKEFFTNRSRLFGDRYRYIQ